MHWLPDLVFLDIETTGGNHTDDRITEVALIKIEGGEILTVWESLINPDMPIPRQITGLTGIADEMVREAPTFKHIAGELYSYLEGQVMVAHNVRFDYGFLKAEYKRMGGTLRQRTLCTVKLSRKLYPHVHGHSLDAIMQRFGLTTKARHRSMGDVQLMLDFLEAIKQDLGSVKVLEAISLQLKGPTLPSGVDESFLNNIQDIPGVYIFYDHTDLPLYIGKSIKLRSRVLSHFASDHVSATEMELAQKVRRIEWRETAGELGALLLESKLIKTMQPAYNRLLRKHKNFYAIQMSHQLNVLPWLKIVTLVDVDPSELEFLYGIFKTKKSAKDLIYKLVDEFQLCCKVLGMEKGKGKCFGEHVGKCTGVCVGKEKHELHHLRLKMSLAPHQLKAWPYQGKVGIKELNIETNKTELHVFEQWCYLETIDSDADLAETIQTKYRLQFDLDIYRLIGKAFSNNHNIIQFDNEQLAYI
ncbi:MAG: GIY-YIG nuclease family protein [Pedobacter sp.]|nr:GIY-YIG nuclease family protein [Pedobacter sp.]